MADFIHAELRKRGWTYRDFAHEIRRISTTSTSKTGVSDWCNGKYVPGPLHLRLIARVFNVPVERTTALAEEQERIAKRPVHSTDDSRTDGIEPGLLCDEFRPEVVDSEAEVRRRQFLQHGLSLLGGAAASTFPMLDQELIMAAKRSRSLAASLTSQSLHPAALDQLHNELVRIAGGFWRTPPLSNYNDARQAQELALGLLQRTSRPEQQRDLYLLLGAAAGLLASATFDLASLASAREHAHAAWILGAHAGHNGLSAWAGGMEALISYWSGRPLEAIELVQKALQQVPSGTARVRLFSIEARAWSHVGDVSRVDGAVAAAAEARQQAASADDLHDGIGGEFGFDLAQQALCNGTAYIQVGEAQEAVRQVQTAVDLYENVPAERRSAVFESRARVDLAAAYLMQSDFDGASHALHPVFNLPPAYRIGGLVHRLGRVDQLLQVGKGSSVEARLLAEQIQDFMANTPLRVQPAIKEGL